MARTVFGIILLLSAGLLATGQDSQGSPAIRLELPSGMPSDSFQISYFMTGPFGGYGDFVTPVAGRFSYSIVAAVHGKPAERVKLISYAPGCEIETLNIDVQSQTNSQPLSCVPLTPTILRGQITAASVLQKPGEVEVTYLATWVHRFFGITDGPVAAIRVATAIPDQEGNFEVALPEFSAQANLGEAEFQFTLREIKTGNILALFRPAEEGTGPQGLKVEASYPELIRFSSAQR